jgi:hypothetical protein
MAVVGRNYTDSSLVVVVVVVLLEESTLAAPCRLLLEETPPAGQLCCCWKELHWQFLGLFIWYDAFRSELDRRPSNVLILCSICFYRFSTGNITPEDVLSVGSASSSYHKTIQDRSPTDSLISYKSHKDRI